MIVIIFWDDCNHLPDVVSVELWDENLSFMVEQEDPAQHDVSMMNDHNEDDCNQRWFTMKMIRIRGKRKERKEGERKKKKVEEWKEKWIEIWLKSEWKWLKFD